MNYEQTLDFLFSALPMYQRVGPMAFKKDLSNTIALCEALGNPQEKFKSVHVAGTNGKGSSSHSIAAVLQTSGYNVGLYTSPHLKSFTERIRIDGVPISESQVVEFVQTNKALIEEVKPSFFEMTVAMAFDHFAKAEVDIAVIEVGLGGRLDSTNVITPEVSLITNIGLDHTDMLGDTLAQIASEKAGVIKLGIPVVVGMTQDETVDVFKKKAAEVKAPIRFADRGNHSDFKHLKTDLVGPYHQKNLPGILETLSTLAELGYNIKAQDIADGLANVGRLTGIKGRWQKLSNKPLTICDTGHNREAFHFIINELEALSKNQLHLVLGFVNDKNVGPLMGMLPRDAKVCFCKANVPRAMNFETLRGYATEYFPDAQYIEDVNEALIRVSSEAGEGDLIFVGGSTFVVAELNNL